MATNIEIEILASTDAATKAIKDFSENTQKQLTGINVGTFITALAEGAEIIEHGFDRAFEFIKSGFEKAIEEANLADQANIKLTNTLKLMGDFSESTVKSFEEFAGAIQKTTAVSDNQAISALALAKSLGLSNAEAARTVQIATDLSAKLGEDLNSSTLRLARTLNGTVDKELKKYFSALLGISQQQLIMGQGLDVIESKVKGTASSFAGSFQGAIAQASNSFNKIFEEFGLAVIRTPEVINAIQSLGVQFGEVAVFVAKSAPAISAFTVTLIDLVAGVTVTFLEYSKIYADFRSQIAAIDQYIVGILKNISEVVKGFFEFLITSTAAGTARIQSAFNRLGDVLDPRNIFKNAASNKAAVDAYYAPLIQGAKDLQKQIDEGVKKSATEVRFGGNSDDGAAARLRLQVEERQKILAQFTSEKKTIELASLSESARISKEFGDREILVQKAYSFGFIQSKEEENKILLGLEEEKGIKLLHIQNKIRNEGEAAEQKYEKERRDFIERASKDPIKQLVNISFGASVDNAGATAIGAGLLSGILKGAEGAKSLVAGILGGVADTLLPGIGGVVSEIVNVLGEGPDKVKQMVQQFSAALPVIIKNIILALPDLLIELQKAVPALVTSLANASPEIAQKLGQAMPQVAESFILQLPRISLAFSQGLIRNLPGIVKGFIDGLLDGSKQFIQAIIDGIKSAIGSLGGGAVGSISGSGGHGMFSGVPVLGGIGDLLGFADGGRTPNSTSLSGDRGLVKIGPDEQVFKGDLTRRMERYLDANEGGKRDSRQPDIVINFGLQQFARISFDARKAGYQL